jgi:hypothetical protein
MRYSVLPLPLLDLPISRFVRGPKLLVIFSGDFEIIVAVIRVEFRAHLVWEIYLYMHIPSVLVIAGRFVVASRQSGSGFVLI